MEIVWFGKIYFEATVKNRSKEKMAISFFPCKKGGKEEIILLENGSKSEGGGFFTINEPGEYDIKDIYIKAIPSFDGDSLKIIYRIEAEGIKTCHIGNFSKKELSVKELEAMGDIDVLIIPIGGSGLAIQDAKKIISQVEPRIIIPAWGEKAELEQFLKLTGAKNIEPQRKIKIEKKNLPKEETQVSVPALK